jgi:membrane protease YdiL (CAAX protease family)
MNDSTGAAVEVFCGLLACLYGGGLVKNVFFGACAAQPALPPALCEHASGLGHVVGLALTYFALYSLRFRPGSGSLLAAARSAAAGLGRACLPPRALSLPSWLMLAFHAGSLAWLLAPHLSLGGGDGSGGGGLEMAVDAAAAHLTACATPTALLWAPLFEELLFRGALFYLALHRSRGQVPLSACLCAGAFAAMHAPNVFALRADWGYVALQVCAAAVCGGAWTAVFAARGSLAEVTLLHAANNAVATVWLARGGGTACSLAPPPLEERGAALVSLGLQTAVYTAGGVMAWRELQRSTEGDGGAAFRALHPLVYPTGAVEQGGGSIVGGIVGGGGGGGGGDKAGKDL